MMKFSKSLKKDVIQQVGSIYSWNASNNIGYLFTVTTDGRSVCTGMFAHRAEEIEPDSWDGFYHKGAFYDLSQKAWKKLRLYQR